MKPAFDHSRQSNLFVDDDQLRLAEPPKDYATEKCRTATPKNVKHNILKSPTSKSPAHKEEQLLITKMIDELKMKNVLKSTSTIANDRDEAIPDPQITSSPENMKDRRDSVKRSKSP